MRLTIGKELMIERILHFCEGHDDIKNEHHYRVDLFYDTIDNQLEELKSRFSEGTMELLILSSSLDLSNNFK